MAPQQTLDRVTGARFWRMASVGGDGRPGYGNGGYPPRGGAAYLKIKGLQGILAGIFESKGLIG